MATPTSLPATFVSGNVLTAAQMNNLRGAFRIMQVVQTTKTDTFTTTSTSLTDITGMSVAITPTDSASKVLIVASVAVDGTNGVGFTVQLVRGSTAIGQGDTAGSRPRGTIGGLIYGDSLITRPIVWLDSPATTSATTYKLQGRVSSGTFYLNRTVTDTDSAVYPRVVSTITAFEVSA